jgi:hypothetical protein
MNHKIASYTILAVALSACGPFHNKYLEPTTLGDMVSVEVTYTGDYVYPQPLFFGEGKTCSRPQDLQIQPLGMRRVGVHPGQVASFMLGDLTPVSATGSGLSVGICNMAFSFTPKPGKKYRIVRGRTKDQCSINLMELTSTGAVDITSTISKRQYSLPFWGGNGPYCKD